MKLIRKTLTGSLTGRAINRRTGMGQMEKLLELQQRMQMLEQQLQYNEKVWKGFRYIEISLIGTHDLAELFAVLRDAVRESFDGIDAISVSCFDEDFRMLRTLENTGVAGNPDCIFQRISPGTLNELFSRFDRPVLGYCRGDIQSKLFPRFKGRLGSVAIAPLVLKDRIIGSFNQGSIDPEHFSADVATDLLDHLSAVLAVCLANTMAHEQLREDGLTDPLTGLSNRRFFERRLQEEIDRWRRHGKPLSCLLADLDFFKQINDKHGHQAGDMVLQEAARELGAELRASDVIARFGGEEFVLLLPDTDIEEAMEIAARLRCRIEALDWTEKVANLDSVTSSFGVAILEPGGGNNAIDPGRWLLQQADKALYRAKAEGRNRVICA
ncbi:MAG: DUF484 family protein [Gammaproteobacteria bacterium]|nr:DUF484 family protein [Gammaproteobacteria bacterium]